MTLIRNIDVFDHFAEILFWLLFIYTQNTLNAEVRVSSGINIEALLCNNVIPF